MAAMFALATALVAMNVGPVEPEKSAAQYLKEASEVCRRDDSALWHFSLCGPLLLVDPASRELFANQADSGHELRERDGVFTGKLPPDVNVANTALTWSGVEWTMIMLPLPEEPDRRAALFGHEMWHRIQKEIGFPLSGAANSHLDTRDGRYWLQLEWRALGAALNAHGEEEKNAIAHALLFRTRRRQIFPQAAAEERSMEMNEGLAEYTGVRLSGNADPRRFVLERELREAPAQATFVRSFAYATGPAYGLLLDEKAPDWRKKLRSTDDLGELLARALGIHLPTDVTARAVQRAEYYDGAALLSAETEQEHRRAETEKMYAARFVEGPVLTLPLEHMKMQFDPGNLVPLRGHGTVYPNIRIVDDWGVLDVTRNGALLSDDFGQIRVAAPAARMTSGAISGDGWKLKLKPGWRIRAGKRATDYILTRE